MIRYFKKNRALFIVCINFITKNFQSKLMLFVLSIFVFNALSPIVYAISPEQIKAYQTGSYFYDPDDNSNLKCNTVSESKSLVDNTSVYVLADSYGDGYKSDLSKRLKTAGYNPIDFNISVGRSIKGAGTTESKTSGITAVDKDQETIKKAGTIIIELGTNPEDGFEKNLKHIVADITKINPTARLFWVNVSNKSVSEANQKSTNKAIADNAASSKYTVIDWNKIAENKYFAADKIHPASNGGWAALSKLIADALGPVKPTSDTATTATATATTAKATVKPSGYVKKNANAATAYGYFLGKGLSAVQTVSILGNLYGESGINPDNGENGNKSKVPVNGVGFGIAQWTFTSRQAGLVKLANKQNKPPTNLGVQLDYVWQELTNGYKSSVLKPLKKITNLRDGWSLVIDKFESPNPALKASREANDIPKAKEYLKEFAGITASDAAATSNNNCPVPDSTEPGTAGVGGWDIKGDHPMVYYSQSDPKWADKVIEGGRIGSCNCGQTSWAMVVATLIDPSITPVEASKYIATTSSLNKGGCGTSSSAFVQIGNHYKLKVNNIGTDLGKAEETLNNGGLIIMSLSKASISPDGGHWLVIRKTENGKFYLADPQTVGFSAKTTQTYKANSSKSFTADDLKGGGMNGLWSVTK